MILTTDRQPSYPIQPVILNRWSPRAMTGEGLSDEDLLPLFEAARWAPSSRNEQPWRFIYAKREEPEWGTFFNLLNESNQVWCKHAAVLTVLISKKTFSADAKANAAFAFDAGASCENFALEGTSRGLVAHCMVGFDDVRARKELNVPGDFEVIAIVAIGTQAV